MNGISLKKGLIDVGGILTETYVRVTDADTATKQELGLDTSQEHLASVGIASISEYITMSMANVSQGQTVVFDLAQFEQDLVLESLFIDNANQDQVVLEVWLNPEDGSSGTGGTKLLTQTFNRNKTPVDFPSAPLPPSIQIRVRAKTDIAYMQLAFKPCVILTSALGTILGGSDGRGDE